MDRRATVAIAIFLTCLTLVTAIIQQLHNTLNMEKFSTTGVTTALLLTSSGKPMSLQKDTEYKSNARVIAIHSDYALYYRPNTKPNTSYTEVKQNWNKILSGYFVLKLKPLAKTPATTPAKKPVTTPVTTPAKTPVTTPAKTPTRAPTGVTEHCDDRQIEPVPNYVHSGNLRICKKRNGDIPVIDPVAINEFRVLDAGSKYTMGFYLSFQGARRYDVYLIDSDNAEIRMKWVDIGEPVNASTTVYVGNLDNYTSLKRTANNKTGTVEKNSIRAGSYYAKVVLNNDDKISRKSNSKVLVRAVDVSGVNAG